MDEDELKKAAYLGLNVVALIPFPQEYATMAERSSSTISFPGSSSKDVLSDVLRQGAQRMLAQAIEAEVGEWIDDHSGVTDLQGRRQVVRNGYLPKRTISSGIGPIEVEQPRVLDRRAKQQQEPFSSKILPPYLRKTKSLEELIPWLYLKGISTGDFSEALTSLVGPSAKGLSPATVTRLKQIWKANSRNGTRDPSKESSTFTSGPMACTSTSAWRKIGNASWF